MANSYNELFGLGTHSEDAALEGWWKLQDTTSNVATDSSSNGRDGAINGMGSNPVTATGPSDYLPSAFDFDGSDDFISCGNNADLKPILGTDNFTLGAWINVSLVGEDGYLLGSTSGTSEGTSLYYRGLVNRIVLSVGTNITHPSSSDAVFSQDGNWVFIAATATGTSVEYYKNGAGAGSATIGTATAGTNDFIIGRRNGAFVSAVMFQGLMASPFAFSRALTGAEVDEINDGPEPVFSVNPTLSGTATVGETLSSTTGTAEIDQTAFAGLSNGTVTYSYQWTRSDDNTGTGEADISGATSSTYTLVSGDISKFIRCRVRASNLGGFDSAQDTNTAFSAEVADVSSGPTDLAADPVTAGVPVVDAASLTSTTSIAADAVLAGTPVLDSTSLTSTTSLSADPVVAGTPVVDASSITSTTSLVADGVLAGIPVLDAANLSIELFIESLTVTSPSSLAIRITGTTNGNRVQYVFETAPGSEPAVDATPTGFEDVTPNSPFQIDITGLSAGNKRVWARAVRTGS